MVHRLDAILALAMTASPQDRLELVWLEYEREHDVTLGRPPSPVEQHAVGLWFGRLRAEMDVRGAYPAATLRYPVHRSLAAKASALAQDLCQTCNLDPDSPMGPVSFPIGVDPWSAQSTDQRVRIREHVTAELRRQQQDREPHGAALLCVTIVTVLPVAVRRPLKDVDNAVKGLLDALEGVAYANDRQIQHLNVHRVPVTFTPGYYLVAIRAVLPHEVDVVDLGAPGSTLMSGIIGALPSP